MKLNEEAENKVSDVKVNNKVKGKVVAETNNGKTKYYAFDNSGNKLGNFRKEETAVKSVMSGKPKVVKPIKKNNGLTNNSISTELHERLKTKAVNKGILDVKKQLKTAADYVREVANKALHIKTF